MLTLWWNIFRFFGLLVLRLSNVIFWEKLKFWCSLFFGYLDKTLSNPSLKRADKQDDCLIGKVFSRTPYCQLDAKDSLINTMV